MRNNNVYPLVSGIVFGIVAVLQVIRAVNGWPVHIASFDAPVWLSWIAAVITGSLSFWAVSIFTAHD